MNDGGASILAGPVLWGTDYIYLTADNNPNFAGADVVSAPAKFYQPFTDDDDVLVRSADELARFRREQSGVVRDSIGRRVEFPDVQLGAQR